MTNIERERRLYPRQDQEISCKCRRSARSVFNPGRTIDVSAGGACIEFKTPRTIELGERMALAFANTSCPVTRSSKMIGAKVVRIDRVDELGQIVAVEFDCPQMGLEGLVYRAAA